MAEVPPPKRDAPAAGEDEQTTKKQKTEGGTGLKRADGTPWEPITGTLVPIVGGKEGLKQVRDAAWPWHFKLKLASQSSTRGTVSPTPSTRLAREPHGARAATPSS